MQPSRRSFLFGWPAAARSEWGRFCQRLARICQGRLEDAGGPEGEGVARLAAARPADVAHARELCAEFGVTLALAGAAPPAPGRPVLWVDPAALNELAPVPDAPGLWQAQAGCTVGALCEAGLLQFANAPADMTLAAWLAGPAAPACPPRRTAACGVLAADVMLADGTRARLGPFGERDVLPLRTLAMQRLVPKLFELAAREPARRWLQAGRWPARARLDALQPAQGTVYLSHLLVGHGGALAWLESAVLLAAPAPAPVAMQHATPEERAAAAELDGRVKALFDPAGRLPPLPAG